MRSDDSAKGRGKEEHWLLPYKFQVWGTGSMAVSSAVIENKGRAVSGMGLEAVSVNKDFISAEHLACFTLNMKTPTYES